MFGTEPELSGIYTASSDGTGQPSGENLLPDPYRLVHGIAELSVAPARDQTLSIRFQNGQETAWVSHLQSRVEVEIAAEDLPPAVEGLVQQGIADRFPEADVSFQGWSTGFGVGDTIFAYEWDIPWEVDEGREILSEEV